MRGDLLMDQGCCLLVYPGGAREAWKRTTDKPYDILWGSFLASSDVLLTHTQKEHQNYVQPDGPVGLAFATVHGSPR